jgi:hypothetical protein
MQSTQYIASVEHFGLQAISEQKIFRFRKITLVKDENIEQHSENRHD